ncbi:MAG TPA: rhomboid family intramembrane serine protease [Acidobacteriaceae bacterium]|nr:rhomboid family intramembrane serine protease [Acidobacteriaceae bacterium]
MARYESMTMSFPPFGGVVRRLVLINVGVFFAVLVLGLVSHGTVDVLLDHLALVPAAVAHGEIWQLVTYSFLNLSPLGILFSMLTLWFCGSILEGSYGTRWFAELYFTSAIAGAVLASALTFTHALRLSPYAITEGAWPALYGVLIAIAVRFGDLEFMPLFPFRFTIRAKYMVAIYILIDLAFLLRGGDAFSALANLSGALCGYLYLRFAPRRGLGFGLSEQYYGARNAYYRAKRRRAAKKFEVYMGKQGRKVQFDKEGRYIDPDEERRDPNDRKWMN